MDKKIVDAAMAAIQETYGYGKPGSHPKKCEICGKYFEEPNDTSILILRRPSRCPDCKEILELRDLLADHWNKYQDLESNNPVEERNFIQDSEPIQNELGGTTTTYTLDDFTEKIIVKRSHEVENIIESIERARNFLYFQVDAQFTILESLFERKDRFWDDGGNFKGYVRDASLQVLVIKLREYLGSKSKLSLGKLRNRIHEKRKAIYLDGRPTIKKTFKRSGDVMETQFPIFPIEEYLSKLDTVLETYKSTIDAMIDYRDNLFAHLDSLKNAESAKYMTFTNVKRIFNSLKVIYDGLLYSVAPDRFKHLRVEHNMWFDHMNHISEYWAKSHGK